MSNYISGNVGNTVSTEHGEFIQIGPNFTVRASLVQAFSIADGDENGKETVLIIIFSGYSHALPYSTPELCKQQFEQLKWFYAKQYGKQS